MASRERAALSQTPRLAAAPPPCDAPPMMNRDPEREMPSSREQAARETALVLHFRDGELPVAVGGARARKSRPAADKPGQGDLF